MKLEWSAVALADLDRFAAFLHDRHPRLAQVIAAEIKEKARLLVVGFTPRLPSFLDN